MKNSNIELAKKMNENVNDLKTNLAGIEDRLSMRENSDRHRHDKPC